MVKMLWISPTITHPTSNGAQKRMLRLARALTDRGVHITPLFASHRPPTPNQEKQLNAWWGEFFHVSRPHALPHESPRGYNEIDDWHSDDISKIVCQLISEKQIDVIFTNYCFMTGFVKDLKRKIPVIIDTHDAISGRQSLYDKAGTQPGFFCTNEAEELKGLTRGDIIIAIQESERASFSARIPEKTIITIGHTGNTWKEPHVDSKGVDKIGILASNHVFNRFAVNRFLGHYRKYFKNAPYTPSITIAGSVCSSIKMREPWLSLQGYVSDLENFFDSVDLLVVPDEIGTGLKIKTIEAFYSGRPVLSTRVGTDGLDVRDVGHTAPSSEDLITELYWLLHDQDRLSQMQALSKEFASKYQKDTNTSIDKLLELISGGPEIIPIDNVEAQNKAIKPLHQHESRYEARIGEKLNLDQDQYDLSSNDISSLGWETAGVESRVWAKVNSPYLPLKIIDCKDSDSQNRFSLKVLISHLFPKTDSTRYYFLSIVLWTPRNHDSLSEIDAAEIYCNSQLKAQVEIRAGYNQIRFTDNIDLNEAYNIKFQFKSATGRALAPNIRLDSVKVCAIDHINGRNFLANEPVFQEFLTENWYSGTRNHRWSNGKPAKIIIPTPSLYKEHRLSLRLRVFKGTLYQIYFREELVFSGTGSGARENINLSIPAASGIEISTSTIVIEVSRPHFEGDKNKPLGVCLFSFKWDQINKSGSVARYFSTFLDRMSRKMIASGKET